MTRTILLADDSVTIQKVVELTFLDEDFRVISFGNGAEAIERLGDIEPDIVLADVHMPGADGYELCASVRERYAGMPVLLLVGTFEVFDAERAKQVGASGHLKKPFDSQDLLQRVKDLAAFGQPSTAAPAEISSEEPEAASGARSPNEVAAVEEPSWSFEPAVDVAPAVETEFSASAADTWGGVEPPAFEAIEEDPSGSDAEEIFAVQEVAVDLPESDTSPAYLPEEPVEEMAPAAISDGRPVALSDGDVDRIARRVVDLLGDQPIRDVAWEVVPDLAEVLLKARIRELEASVE